MDDYKEGLLRDLVKEITFFDYEDPDDGTGKICPYCHLMFDNEEEARDPRAHAPHGLCVWRMAYELINAPKEN